MMKKIVLNLLIKIFIMKYFKKGKIQLNKLFYTINHSYIVKIK